MNNKYLFLFATCTIFSFSSMSQKGLSGMPFGKGSDCVPKASYHFKGKMDMQITSSARSAKDTAMVLEFHSYFNDSGSTLAIIAKMDMGSQVTNMTTIVNMKDTLMIMLIDMGPVKFATCQSQIMKSYLDTVDLKKQSKFKEWDFNNFKPTGRTKKICNYLCKEYVYENNETSALLWISEEIEGLGILTKGFGGSSLKIDYPYGMKGLPMEIFRTDKKTMETFEMLVTGIDLNANMDISTDGFTVH